MQMAASSKNKKKGGKGRWGGGFEVFQGKSILEELSVLYFRQR